MSTSKDHEATPSLSIWGWPGVTASNSFSFVSKSRQKTPYFGELGLYFPWPLEAITLQQSSNCELFGPNKAFSCTHSMSQQH